MSDRDTGYNKSLNEVRFANHIFEFIRFYKKQKSLNDEIAGLSEITHVLKGKDVVYLIEKSNFITAIKRLYAFVIDNLHYVKSYSDGQSVLAKVESIEKEFLEDTKYQELGSRKRSDDEEVELTLMYLKYVIRCFDIGNIMCNLLQNSLMIGTRDIKKNIGYFNEREFFEHLSRYRDEIASEISNFKMVDLFDHFKKILAYYYTYRILLIKDERVILDDIVRDSIDLITSREIAETIIKLKAKNIMDDEEMDLINTVGVRLRKVFSLIYFSTNKELSERNVLPKITRKKYIDESLI